MHQDTIPSMITEVLQKLDKSLWYLNEKGGMYHFAVPSTEEDRQVVQDDVVDVFVELIHVLLFGLGGQRV